MDTCDEEASPWHDHLSLLARCGHLPLATCDYRARPRIIVVDIFTILCRIDLFVRHHKTLSRRFVLHPSPANPIQKNCLSMRIPPLLDWTCGRELQAHGHLAHWPSGPLALCSLGVLLPWPFVPFAFWFCPVNLRRRKQKEKKV